MKLNKFIFTFSTLALFFLIIACGGEQTTDKTPTSEKVTAAKTPKKKMSQGERLFLLCQACHSLKKGEAHKTGPNLHGLFGKKAATEEGYANYSEAMKTSGIIWGEKELKEWLTKPNDYLPGTSMAFIGIEDKDQQQALIDYLKEETK